jgi:hypothetical protein
MCEKCRIVYLNLAEMEVIKVLLLGHLSEAKALNRPEEDIKAMAVFFDGIILELEDARERKQKRVP